MQRTILASLAALLILTLSSAHPVDADFAEADRILPPGPPHAFDAPFTGTGAHVVIDGTIMVVNSYERIFREKIVDNFCDETPYPKCWEFNDPTLYPIVLVYEHDGTDWVHVARLTDDDEPVYDYDGWDTYSIPNGWTPDNFGSSQGLPLAIDGDTAVVGAIRDGDNGNWAGAAYVFVRDDGGTPADPSDDTWPQQAKLTPSDGQAGQYFGQSVALEGDTLVVGADGGSGAFYIFERSGSNWTQQSKHTEPNGGPGHEFGHHVAISGSTIVAGAYEGGPPVACLDDGLGWTPDTAGRAYVYEQSGGSWPQTPDATLAPSDEASCQTAGFGYPVTIGNDGNTIVAGAEHAGMSAAGTYDGPGALYVFERNGSTWDEVDILAPGLVIDDADPGNYYFPEWVAVDEDTIAASTRFDDTLCPATSPDCNAGAAFVFERSGGTWSETQKVATALGFSGIPGSAQVRGGGVAVQGSTVLIGETGDEPWGPDACPRAGTNSFWLPTCYGWETTGAVHIYAPDEDADGLTDDFETGFGGTIPEDSLTITNPETGDQSTATGSAAEGATISSGSFAVELPAGSSVASGADAIEISLDPNLPARVEVSSADLGGGTKSIRMPFDGDASDPAVCIDDAPTASIDSILVGGTCNTTLIAIPPGEGDSVTQGAYTVTRTSDDPALVTVDGLSHTALATIDIGPPVVGEIDAVAEPVEVGSSVGATASYSDLDEDVTDASFDWGDGSTSSGGIDSGANTVSGAHTYTDPGVYRVTLTLTDADGNTGSASFEYVVVYDPAGGFVTGGGWIDSPAGAYVLDPALTGRANFGFVSKYQQGASIPEGDTNFQFRAGDLHFESTGYDWLVIAGQDKAKFKGSGTTNDLGNYGFLLTAVDNGNGGDTFRIKIWDKDAGDTVVYDNQSDGNDEAYVGTAIGGGNIRVHKK